MRPLIAAVILVLLVEPALAATDLCTDESANAIARVAACTRIVETAPTVKAYLDRADAYAAAQKWADARADVDRALALEPSDVETLLLRARLRWGEDMPGAIADMNRVIALRPSAEVFLERASMKAYDDDKGAIADYTHALTHDPKSVEALSGRAEALLRLNEEGSARDDYDRALALDPHHAEILLARGKLFLRQARVSQAIADLTAAIALAPNNLDAYRVRASAHALRSAFDAAIADLSRVLAAEPTDVESLRARRRAYLDIGDSTRAIADANQVYAVRKYDYVSDRLERGIAYLRRGGEPAFANAEADFKAAANIERRIGAPKSAAAIARLLCALQRARSFGEVLLAAAPSRTALNRHRAIADAEAYMGILALKRGDDTAATAIFAAALQMSRESAVAYYGRGVVKHHAGDAEGAKDDFATARSYNGETHRLYARAGIEPVPAPPAKMVEPVFDAAGSARDIGLCQRGDFSNVDTDAKLDFANEIEACTRLIRANPAKDAKAQAYANRARWRGMKNDRAGAIDDYNAALTVDPDNVEALISIGGHLTAQRKYEEAIAAFDRAVKGDPKSFQALFGRCEARIAQGNVKTALADCDQAVAVAGDDSMVKARRAPMLLRAGENKRALTDYDLILREFARHGLPDEPSIRFGRAVALKRLGETAGAEIDFKKARAQDPNIDQQFAELGIKP